MLSDRLNPDGTYDLSKKRTEKKSTSACKKRLLHPNEKSEKRIRKRYRNVQK